MHVLVVHNKYGSAPCAGAALGSYGLCLQHARGAQATELEFLYQENNLPSRKGRQCPVKSWIFSVEDFYGHRFGPTDPVAPASLSLSEALRYPRSDCTHALEGLL